MEDNHTDILCVQEAKIPHNSFFRFGEYICITSTDIKGGEKPPHKITKAVPEDREPKVALEKMNPGKKEVQSRPSTQKENESTVEYIVRKVGEKADSRESTEMFFETMYKNADRENSVGKTFTTSEIGEAFVICMGKLETPSGKSKGKGKKGSGKGGYRHQTVTEHHGVMFMYHKDLE